MTSTYLKEALAEAEARVKEGDTDAFLEFQGKCMGAVIIMLERLENLERVLEIAPRGLS